MFARNKFVLISVLAFGLTATLGSRYAQETTEPSWVAAPVTAQEPLLVTQGPTCEVCERVFDAMVAACEVRPGVIRLACIERACSVLQRCLEQVTEECDDDPSSGACGS